MPVVLLRILDPAHIIMFVASGAVLFPSNGAVISAPSYHVKVSAPEAASVTPVGATPSTFTPSSHISDTRRFATATAVVSVAVMDTMRIRDEVGTANTKSAPAAGAPIAWEWY